MIKKLMTTITIPYNFNPRDYQIPLLRAIDSGYKRAVAVWHRRAGKDKTLINIVAKKMLERVGSYYYVFPTYNQGRKILWDGMDKDGFKFLAHFPSELLVKKPNDTEMKLELKNGSRMQVVGSDNVDSIVGTNPIGVVFSEYALQDPSAWDYLRPILAENSGWAIFNFTPRGKNHGYHILQLARNNPAEWYSQVLTVDDTHAIPADVIEQERREVISQYGNDALIQQEYYCSFDAALPGAYYAKQMSDAERDKRITSVPWEPQLQVSTWWDLGMDDSTTIWFTQSAGAQIRVIDYLECNGKGLEYYAKTLKEKPYVYDTHNLPHDVRVRELGTGKSREDTLLSLGVKPVNIIPRVNRVEDRVNAARNIIPRCWFDAVKCERGINALKSYHAEFDDKKQVMKDNPVHDWSSHGADAFGQMSLGYRDKIKRKEAYTTDSNTKGYYRY